MREWRSLGASMRFTQKTADLKSEIITRSHSLAYLISSPRGPAYTVWNSYVAHDSFSLLSSASLNLTAFDLRFMHSQRYIRIASAKASVENYIIHEARLWTSWTSRQTWKSAMNNWLMCLNFVLFFHLFLYLFILWSKAGKRCTNNFQFYEAFIFFSSKTCDLHLYPSMKECMFICIRDSRASIYTWRTRYCTDIDGQLCHRRTVRIYFYTSTEVCWI